MDGVKQFLLSVLCVCVAVLHAQTERTHTRDGNKQYEGGKFSDAEADYRKALEQKNNFPEAIFNLGDAVYKQKRYDEAAKQFQLSAQTNADSLTRAKAWHNLGNTALSQDKFEDAVKAYKSALKLNPHDRDTKYNLAYANAKLKQQQQQNQQNKDNKNQDKKDDQKQDQQKQDDKKDQDKKDQQNKDQQSKGDRQKDQKQQQQKPQLSKQDAEKLLQALQNEEQKANQKMMQKQAKPVDVKIQKDW